MSLLSGSSHQVQQSSRADAKFQDNDGITDGRGKTFIIKNKIRSLRLLSLNRSHILSVFRVPRSVAGCSRRVEGDSSVVRAVFSNSFL